MTLADVVGMAEDKPEGEAPAIESESTSAPTPDDGSDALDADTGEQGTTSYRYWTRDLKTAPPPEPKKIDKTVHEEQNKKQANGASAWNAAGTWEERSMTAWALDRVKEILQDSPIPVPGAKDDLKISSVPKCTGEASIVFSRGKKRPGWEFDIKAEYTGTFAHGGEDHEVSGTIETEIALDDLDDFELRVTSEEHGGGHSACCTAIRKNNEFIEKLFRKFHEELMNM